MIICMNIGTDGERHIVQISYLHAWNKQDIKDATNRYKALYDEVYVIDFKENEAFIDEVVLRGCRV